MLGCINQNISLRASELSKERKRLLVLLLKKRNIRLSSIPIFQYTRSSTSLVTSFAQQRLWFLDQYQPGSAFYNIPLGVRLAGVLVVEALERAVNEIVRRHEALRTTFAMADGMPVQVIAPALTISLPLTDLSHLPEQERAARAQQLVRGNAQEPFDLAAGPLLRGRLLRLAPDEHIVLLCMHHIVSDGWSIGVMVNEMTALYNAYAHGQSSPLPELPIQYADFAHWQREWLQGEVLDQQLAYWRTQLDGAPAVLELPTDRPRPAVQTHHGATLPLTLSRPVSAALTALSRQTGSTLFMTLAAAFNVLLWRYSGQADICIGTPIANRNRAEIENLIGFFVNTLVLRTRVDGYGSFAALLAQVREQALNAYAHQDLPFEQLVEELKPVRNLSHSPLFQVLFALQNAPAASIDIPGLSLRALEAQGAVAKFDLSVYMFEGKERLSAVFEYNTDLFERATVERMAAHFTQLLEAVVAEPHAPLHRLPLLGEPERQQILVQWNQTAAPYPAATLPELFEQQVKRSPEATALVFGDRQLSYAQLNAQANRLAHHLRRLGVGPDVLVAICAERSPEMVIGLLAILKAGGAYVPLDPAYPAERLAYMLADAQPHVLLSQRHLHAVLPAAGIPRFELDADWEQLADLPEDDLPALAQPEHLAYVIYTSGSTGSPKGVAIRHRSAQVFLEWAMWTFDKTVLSKVLASTSICFDLSVFELFVPLSAGGTALLVENILHLPHTQGTADLTLINTVPSAIAELDRSNSIPKSVRVINLAGEALSNALVQQLYRRPHIDAIFNLYGPSEDTTYSTFALARKGAAQSPPIGRPIANTRIYILDAYLNPVPIGVPGELHIAGDGLARGYLNRPDLTAEKFVPNPFATTPGARMYKTGDLARYLPDGTINYLGRIDHQVKIRGFRIELGEIEAVLATHPAVRESVVLAREDQPGDRRLVAYLVPAAETPDTQELRAALLRTLPDYMVPAHFVFLERLPLTPNGKTDRAALPAPNASRDQTGYVAPRNPTEQILAEIWADVLKLDQVGIHDNFFELGGHSLLATKVNSRMAGIFGIRNALPLFFLRPTSHHSPPRSSNTLS